MTPASAAQHLDNGRFRDAAGEYKQLLKIERRPEWIPGLSRAYAGRAEHLASRGMINEAIALWRNRAEACGEALADPRYLDWLLAALDPVSQVAHATQQTIVTLPRDIRALVAPLTGSGCRMSGLYREQSAPAYAERLLRADSSAAY